MGAVDNPVSCGVDIGQRHDPTAIVVSEAIQAQRHDKDGAPMVKKIQPVFANGIWYDGYDKPVLETVYIVRFMERVPLGTDYPEIAARIATVVSGVVLAKRQRRLLMDVTGVGRPVFDLVRQIIRQEDQNKQNLTIKAVTFRHGDTYDPTTGVLGKAYLVSMLQALLQRLGITLPANHPDVQQMMREILDYQIKVDEAGKDTYGNIDKVGAHDDYVTALGLSVIEDPWQNVATLGPRLF